MMLAPGNVQLFEALQGGFTKSRKAVTSCSVQDVDTSTFGRYDTHLVNDFRPTALYTISIEIFCRRD
jgi:hypothetical protein